MRLKHVKGAKEKVENSNYVIHNKAHYKGNMNNLFLNDHPLYVEIGMGKGKFIIENAKRYPHINFIGIEKYDSVLVRALETLEGENLSNLKMLCMDAREIDQLFYREIDMIYLNFSDPWPKDRHAKRRLTSDIFLKKYDLIFRKNKHIIMKTDNRHLFEYSLKTFTKYGYYIKNITLNLYDENLLDNIATEYEEKFHSRGCPIYQVEVLKE